MASRIVIGLVIGVGLAMLIAWGWVAALAYAFLALVAALVMWGAAIGARVTRDISRGRFDR